MISKFRKFIVTIALNLIVMGTATGGLMAGAEHVSGISTTQMQGFRQQVQGNAVKFAVNSGVRMAFGEKPKDVLKSGAANFVADVAAGVASNEISGWRQGTIGNGSLFDYTLHKGLHFATGAATRGGAEALMGGNSSAIHRAALSGGMGAATAEILGEKLALDALRSGRMHTGNVTEMMGHISTLSSQTAGLGAALTGLDVSHAQHAGSVAVENNMVPLVAYALAAGIVAMKGKDVYDTADGAIAAYQEDGAEGLVDFGVDEGIGMLVAGTAMKGAKVAGKGAKKALDAVEDMLPDAVTKAVGKAANSAGGVLKEASAVLDSAKGKAKTTVKSVFGLRGGGTKPSKTSALSSNNPLNSLKKRIDSDHFQVHHIISNKSPSTANHPLWELSGVSPDSSLNLMLLPTKKGAVLSTKRSIHEGRHLPGVNQRLKDQMDGARLQGHIEGWSQSEYQRSLREIITHERKKLKTGERILNKNKRSWGVE